MASVTKLATRYANALRAAQANSGELMVTWPGASAADRNAVSALLADNLPLLINAELADMLQTLEDHRA